MVRVIGDAVHDARLAARLLRKSPGFAIVAVLTLGLGIGSTTAVFSIVEAVLLRPLPYRDVDRLVAIWDGHVNDKNLAKIFPSYADFDEWRRSSRTLDAIAAETWATGDQILTGRGPASVVLAIPASRDFFPLLGVPPMLGRTFEPADATRGCTIVLSHRFWRNRLSADPDIAGQSLALDNQACTVAGVMPPSFAFYPDAADMWTLITPSLDQLPHDSYRGVGVFGRLKPGVSLEQAQVEIFALHARAHAGDAHAASFGPTLYPLQTEFTWLAGRNLRLTLEVLLAAVAFVLLIACVNVAQLLLSRSRGRERGFAVRAAIGCGRSRIVRQLLVEGLLLSSLGTLCGVLLAVGAVGAFRARAPIELPPGVAIAVDVDVLAFAVVLAVATALVFGFVPAWRASRTHVSIMLRAGAAAAFRPAAMRAGRVFVAIEMTCAMVLLVGAGLLTESVVHFGNAPLGFDPDRVLTMSVKLPRTAFPQAHQRTQFYDRLLAVVGGEPSVDGVALATTLLRGHSNNLLTVEGRPQPTLDTAAPDVGQDLVSDAYFRVMGVPLRAGRAFDDADGAEAPAVAVVNEALARKYFAGENPIGRRIKYGTPPASAPWVTIVGVAANQKSTNAFQEMSLTEQPFVFRPMSQAPPADATVLVRTAAGPETIARRIQRLVAELDPDVPVANVQPLRERIAKDAAYPQFRAAVLTAFAFLALLLAAVGVYGVLSQLVARRTQEIGIRVALGATPRQIVRLVSVQGGVPTVVGLAIGLASALAFERVLASMLYGVTATDPVTLAAVAGLLLIVAAAGMLVPARRAARIDPLAALRGD